MLDEFIEYVKNDLDCYYSTPSDSLLIWGAKKLGDIKILGLSYNSERLWHQLADHNKINCLLYIGNKLDLPVIWIGNKNNIEEGIELGQIIIEDNKLCLKDHKLRKDTESIDYIQNTFKEFYKKKGTDKAVNLKTAGNFHKWSRLNLPERYIKADIDLTLNKDGNPISLIEVKRSFDPEKWTPFKNDLNNYLLQFRICNKIGIKAILIQQPKTKINDNTKLGFYFINDVDSRCLKWMNYDKEVLSAKKVKKKLEEI